MDGRCGLMRNGWDVDFVGSTRNNYVMWNTPKKVKTCSGSISLVLAYGLEDILEQASNCYEYPDIYDDISDCLDECSEFACLTLEQKVWTLHTIANELFSREPPTLRPAAYLDAAVSTVFLQVTGLIRQEIDFAESEDVEFDVYGTRRAVLATLENKKVQRLFEALFGTITTDFDTGGDNDNEEVLCVVCDDMDRWDDLMECIELSILGHCDFEIYADINDLSPDAAKAQRKRHNIEDDYFTAIPDDPSPTESQKLLQEVRKLCTRVIKREEKKLSKHSPPTL